MLTAAAKAKKRHFCSILLVLLLSLIFTRNSSGFSSNSNSQWRRKDYYCQANEHHCSPRFWQYSTSKLYQHSGPGGSTTTTFSDTFLLTKTITQKKRNGFLRRWKTREEEEVTTTFSYPYDCDILHVPTEGDGSTPTRNATGVILIHPIGVGIAKWLYNRLYQAFFASQSTAASRPSLYLITPDLLGNGDAVCQQPPSKTRPPIPLFNISDWSDQIVTLMTKMEDQYEDINKWCVVANGGCSPIALQVAQRSVEGTAPFQRPVTNIILSSVPRLPFFLEGSSDPKKVAKAYQRLCGVIGKVFWWYSCRNEGAFLQKFSERNLVADPANLGEEWQPNCYRVASQNNGQTKYSTLAFLAGTLQDGCVASLNALKRHRDKIQVHLIKGRDSRRNRAKSWFWQKKKKKKRKPTEESPRRTSFRDYLQENGLGGKEILIGGRITLAHEDAEGYRDAILSFLS
eukprot:scaffold7719_cov95-Cylindrotheca_fusiformis.AAC.2